MEFTKYSTKLEAVRVLTRCVSDDPKRPVLHYINVEKEGEGTRMVATNGRRLCWVDFPRWDDKDDGLYRVITNRKTLVEMIKIEDQDLNCPNWRQVIPAEFSFEFFTVGPLRVLLNCAHMGIMIDPENIPIEKDMHVKVHTNGETDPIMIEHEHFGMIVMPMRDVIEVLVARKLRNEFEDKVNARIAEIGEAAA